MKRVDRLTRDTSTRSVRSLKTIDKGLNDLSKNAANFAKGFAIGAVTAAIGGMMEMVKAAISSAAAIGDLSDKLGTTTDQLQGLQYGAVQANMDFEQLSGSLLHFSKSLGEAANGQGDLLKVLRANGSELKGSYFENLMQFADLVKNARNEQDQMLLITQAFGRGGAPMLEFLKGGSAGLTNFMQTAEDAGAILDEELITKAQDIDDRWAALMLSMQTKFRTMVLTNISAFQDLKKGLDDPTAKSAFGQIMENLGWGGSSAGRPMGGHPGRLARPDVGIGQPSTPTIVPNPEKEKELERARREATRVAEEQAKKIADVIEQLKFEQQQLQASELSQEINNQLRQAGVTATSAQGQQIAALVTKNYELAQSEQLAIEAGEKWVESQEAFKESLTSLAELGVDAFESWSMEGEKLNDILADLSKLLAKAAIQAALFGNGPLAGLAGSSQSGGLFGGLFKQAPGGNLHTGRPTLVGERGPELIVPRGAGYVVPNSGLRGDGGEGGINIKYIDNAGVALRTNERRDAFGRRELDVMIDNRVDKLMNDPYSSASAAMASRGARNSYKKR